MYKGGSNTSSLTKPHGINVGQSAYGKAVKLLYGMPVVAPDLVWYNDWQASGSPTNLALWAVVGGASTGKKGGKASKKSGQKYYSAAVDLLLGHAPVRNIFNAWYNNQRLGVVKAEAAGVISGGQFAFTPDGKKSTTTYTGTIPTGGSHSVLVPYFVSDLNEVKANGVSLQPASLPPGAGQYAVSNLGVYTFNVAQAGQSVSITYRQLAAGGGTATLAGIIGCTVAEPFSAVFNDFGGPGQVTVSGTWERPLWDARYAVPGRLDAGAYRARDPYSWWWDGHVPTVYFPSALDGKPVTVYYCVPAIQKSDGSYANTKDTPLQLLNLEFESAFASGAEYAKHPDQQDIQDWVSGLGSVRFDLGAANTMPNLNLETIAAFAQWPNGDCDVVDAIIDILASGPVLAQPATLAEVGAGGPSGPPETGGGTGTLSGTVLDASTSSPISGATISYSGGSTTSAADGSFTIAGISAGTYNFTVSASGYTSVTQSVTIYGASTTTEFDLTLNNGTPVPPSPPPAGWTAINNIQSLSGWVQAGNTGNTGGGSSKPHGTGTMTANGDGSEKFAIVPASAYDNFYWYLALSPHPNTAPQKLKYHMEFEYPVGDLAKSQGYEFELQFSDGVYTYNMAWACYAGGWYYFHYIGKPGGSWIYSGIPRSVTEGSFCVVDAEFALDASAHTTTHQSLTIDGVAHNLGIIQAAVNNASVGKGTSKYLHAAVQLDSLKNYQAYSVNVKANVLWLP